MGDEVDEVILELANVTDVAVRAGSTMAARIQRPGLDAMRGEGRGQGVVDRAGGAGRAVDEERA